MISPELLEDIDFNEVVMIYNKLNITLTEDIIERLQIMDDITNTTRQELRKIIELNGREIFDKALEECAGISAERKEAVKLIFESVIKEDMKGYEELFEYRNMPFKLSKSQLQILSQAIKQTDKTLKNLTNTVAFRTKEAYVNAVDNAYMQVVTGAIDYNTAIKNTVKEVAAQGITLKDAKGRSVQLETAVRRNILGGVQETTNKINRDIEKELGCDGYEVTAHSGARPEHAKAQGKQYAINKSDAKKYGVGLWKDVEDLWDEYNCRHTYFGIILGVSEPQYTNKELNKMENETVVYKGKEIPLYDATQKQRQLESSLRKMKRTAEILDNSGESNLAERAKIRQLNKQLKDLCKETGLDRKYNREQIAS